METIRALLQGQWTDRYQHDHAVSHLPLPLHAELVGDLYLSMEKQVVTSRFLQGFVGEWSLGTSRRILEFYEEGRFQERVYHEDAPFDSYTGVWELQEAEVKTSDTTSTPYWQLSLVYEENSPAIHDSSPVLYFDGLVLHRVQQQQLRGYQSLRDTLMGDWTTGQVLQHLRQLLSLQDSPTTWRLLCNSLQHWEHTPNWAFAMEYLQEHLSQWPLEFQEAPWPWVLESCFVHPREESYASLQLARSLQAFVQTPEELILLARCREFASLESLTIQGSHLDETVWSTLLEGPWNQHLRYLRLEVDESCRETAILRSLLFRADDVLQNLQQLTLQSSALSEDWKHRLLLSPQFSTSVREHWKALWNLGE